MELLGIGLQELLFVALILLLVLGPADLVNLGRRTGGMIRRIRQSDTWKMVSNLAQALRNLPNALADEVQADEIFKDVVPREERRSIAPPGMERSGSNARPVKEGYSSWTTPPAAGAAPAEPPPDPIQTQPAERSKPDPDPTGTER